MKGSAEIILTDVNTGKVTRYHEDNLVTNAVQDLIRLNPAGLNFAGIPWGLPICPNAIGGVLLFGEELEEDATKYYAPTDYIPVGYASNSADTSSDPKRGSYNSNESYRMDNGYRLVFDFGTSDANGEIKSVCLTSSDGGRAYFGSPYQSDPCWFKNIYATYWDPGEASGLRAINRSMSAIDDGHVYGARDTGAYTTEWNVWDKHVTDLPLGQNVSIINSTLVQTVLTSQNYYNPSGYTDDKGNFSTSYVQGWTSFSYRAGSCWDGTNYYRWYWVKGTNTAQLMRIQNGVLTEWSMSWAGVSLEQANLATIVGGYLYTWKSGDSYVYKLSITDPTDITLISIPEDGGKATTRYAIYSPFNGDGPIYVRWRYTVGSAYSDYAGLIFGEKMVRTYLYTYDYALNSNNYTVGKGLRIGPYMLRTYHWSSTTYGWNLSVVAPYLATINNLASPITKTVTQTMKIIYTLTEE